MIIAPFDKNREYDYITQLCFSAIDKSMQKNNDDGFIICAGRRGTGKTTLMFHCYQQYAGEEAVIDQVAFNQGEMSIALDNASKSNGKRFVGYDEANVNKRDALTRWNKRLMDTYMNIRGLQIFHWWNNPSVEMLDKPFIEECVKGMIFVITKSPNRPRLFYYFTQEGLVKLIEEKGDLKARTVKKHGAQYAHHFGWFKAYKGKLWQEYLEKKDSRMTMKVSELREEFAPQTKTSILSYSNKSKIAHDTGGKIFNYGREKNFLKSGEHYVVLANGRHVLLPSGIAVMDKLRVSKAYLQKLAKSGLEGSHNIILPEGLA